MSMKSTGTLCLVLMMAMGWAAQAASTPFSVNAIYDAMVANDESQGPDQSVGGSGLHVRDIPVRRRVALVSFDISAIKEEGVLFQDVALEVIAADGGTLTVYGVIEELDNISGDLTWNTAPGVVNSPAPAAGSPVALDSDDLTDLLLTFTGIPGGSTTRVKSEPSQALADFMNTDTDGIITLLLAPPENGGQLILRSAIRWNNANAGIVLEGVMGGVPKAAAKPLPEDGLTNVHRDGRLSWTAGGFAASHDIYLGTAFSDVNDASRGAPRGVLVSEGQNADSLLPGPLELGATYYWRVDEVNSAPDYTIFKGAVWSFTVEPVAIPIETVTATASGANANMGPENTINGSGLNELDQHSTVPSDMWLAPEVNPWIQYDFDKAYKLHQMLVWNSNQQIEGFIGFGAKDVTIEYSADGDIWTALDATALNQATGLPTYEANTAVALGGIVAQAVKVTVVSAYGMTGQAGLSELRFMAIPTDPRELVPADGSLTSGVEVSLNWRAGREAAVHEVRLGTDPTNLALVSTSDEAGFTTDSLDFAQTYYWQVTNINEAETPAAYVSEISHFNTPAFGTVDDFESYSGEEGKEVFMTWWDGFGGDGSLGGSTTGHIEGPFVETAIVSTGEQSMPIFYDNNGNFVDIDGNVSSPAFSEVVQKFDPAQDWTESAITTLVITFYGNPGNTGQLYVRVNDQKIPYSGDAANLSIPIWSQWNIDLASVNTNLSNIKSLSIGVDGGAEGMILVDDIRLYAVAPALPDEIVWAEAETGSATAPMQVFATSETPGASGTGYVSCPVGTADEGNGPTAPDGTLTLPFTVEGGVYTIRFRVAFPGGDDSCWVRIPTATIDSAVHTSGWIHFNDIPTGTAWHWSQSIKSEDQGGEPPVQFTLGAGTHTIEIAYRGAELKIDAIQLTRIEE